VIAAFLRAGQVKVFAQRIEQGHPAIQPELPPTPVDLQDHTKLCPRTVSF
jgi:hypothetical protein